MTKLYEIKNVIVNEFFIFLVFSFIYYLAIPLELSIFGDSIQNAILFNEGVVGNVRVLVCLSIIGFFIGFVVVWRGKYFFTFNRDKLKPFPKHRAFEILFSIVCIILLLFYSKHMYISFSSYAGNYGIVYNSPIYAYLKEVQFAVVSVLILILIVRRVKPIKYILLSAFLILFGVMSSDKDPVLLGVIPYFYFINMVLRRTRINKFLASIIVFLTLVFFVPFTAYFFYLKRESKIEEAFTEVKRTGLYSRFDAREPLVIANRVIYRDSSYKYGETYLLSLVNWVPRSVWKERPYSLAEIYAKEMMKEYWKPGMGYGFPLIAEAYMNFGIAGGFIQYLMIGLMLGGLGWLTRWLFKGLPTIYADSVFYVFAMYNIVIMHRGQFNLPSAYIRYILPFYCAYLVFDKWKLHTWFWKQITTTFVKR
jgi:hypothetical protein